MAGNRGISLSAWPLLMASMISGSTVVRAQDLDAPRVRTVVYALRDSALYRWRLSSRPLLSIGGADGQGPTEFSGVVGVIRLDDGRVVVADAGSSELRFFGATGSFLYKRAGIGSGPGEVRGLDALAFALDTLYALDAFGGAHLFTHDGTFTRRIPYRMGPAAQFGGDPDGVLAGSALVGRHVVSDWQRRPPGLDSLEIRVLAPSGGSYRLLRTLPSQRTFRLTTDRYKRATAYSPELAVAAFPHEVCASFTATYEVTCLDTLGRTTRVIRREVRSRTVTDSMKRAWRNGMTGRLPDGTSRLQGSLLAHRERVARTTEFMRSLPALSRLLAARTGELWIADFQASDGIVSNAGAGGRVPAGPSRWNIFAPNGAWSGTVTLPPRFRLFDAGRDWVAGVARDADDVERVEVWQLRR